MDKIIAAGLALGLSDSAIDQMINIYCLEKYGHSLAEFQEDANIKEA